MRLGTLLALPAFWAAMQLGAGSAHAQEPEATALAQADVTAAAKHYDAGQYHEAYVRLKSAAAVYPSPHVRANMVLAGSKSTYPPERLDSARVGRALLREGKMKPDDATKVTGALERLAPLLGRIEVRGGGDAAIRIDGALVERAQLADPYDVLPGSHEVLFEAERHVVNVLAGTTAVVSPGETAVVTEPAAPAKPPVAIAPVRETKRVPRDGRPIVIGVLGGLAVASLGAGLATFLVGSSARSDAKDTSLGSDERNDAVDRANQMRTISTITTYAGIGLGVAAVVPLLVWPKKTVPIGTLQLTPLLGPGHLGLRATF